MDLQEFSSGAAQFNAHPTVKSWLNIVAGSVAANSIVTPSLFAQVFGFGSVTTVTTGPITLAANQVVGGVLGLTGTGSDVFLPSASDINDFIGPIPPSIPYFNFTFRVTAAANNGNWNFHPGAGTTLWTGINFFGLNPNVNRVLTYAFTPGGWVIYY